MKVYAPFTESKNFNSIDKYAIFHVFKNDSLKFRFENSNLFIYIDEKNKKIIDPEGLGWFEGFDFIHIFSKFIPQKSYFFDGVNKLIFEGIKDEKPEGMKEYADIISA